MEFVLQCKRGIEASDNIFKNLNAKILNYVIFFINLFFNICKVNKYIIKKILFNFYFILNKNKLHLIMLKFKNFAF